jgi:hypothetical protein
MRRRLPVILWFIAGTIALIAAAVMVHGGRSVWSTPATGSVFLFTMGVLELLRSRGRAAAAPQQPGTPGQDTHEP